MTELLVLDKLHTWYRTLVEYTLPYGSRRREFYSILVRVIRSLSSQGPAGPLRKISHNPFHKENFYCIIKGQNNTHPQTMPDQNANTQSARDELILIYQMGRVGSKSIEASLAQYYSSHQIVHGHYLSSFEELEKRAQTDLTNTASFMADLRMVDNKIRNAIRTLPPGHKLKIVSLVRDPVARNVSTFFFALDEFIPGWEIKFSNNMLSVKDLHSIFESKRSYVLSAFNWFDEQMKPVFDIDVYSTPFPKEIGFRIYSTATVDLLLFRLENLNICVQEAFEEFLGIGNFQLRTVNTAEERLAGDLYRLFKGQPITPEYVKWTYSTKLARHFYSEIELDTFAKRWTWS